LLIDRDMKASRSVFTGGKNVPALTILHGTRAAYGQRKIELEIAEGPVGPSPRRTCADVTVSATWAEVPHIESQRENRHKFATNKHQDRMPSR